MHGSLGGGWAGTPKCKHLKVKEVGGVRPSTRHGHAAGLDPLNVKHLKVKGKAVKRKAVKHKAYSRHRGKEHLTFDGEPPHARRRASAVADINIIYSCLYMWV